MEVESCESGQIQSGAKRRIRTSAAMVGLALSMGAAGLLVPRHGDGASAAESNESAASNSQPVSRIATLSPGEHDLITAPPPAQDSGSSTEQLGAGRTAGREYIVGQGQTLQQIAQRYQISVAALAAANRISPTESLKPGQVLQLPADASATGTAQSSQLAALSELSRLPAPDLASQSQSRAQSLSRLMQEQGKLKQQLSALRRGDAASSDSASSSNKQVPTPVSSPTASVVAITPSLAQPSVTFTGTASTDTASTNTAARVTAPTVMPSPELDWMQANRLLTIPPNASTASPSAEQSAANLPAVKPSALGSGRQAAPAQVAAMGLGAASEQSYQVSLGDTVARIARAHNIEPSALITANRLDNPNIIFVGQMLRVPVASVSSISSSSELPSGLPTMLPSRTQRLSGTALPAVPTQVQQRQQDASTQLAVVPSTLPLSNSAESFNLSIPAAGGEANDTATGRSPYVQNLLSEVKAMRSRRAAPAEAQASSQAGRSQTQATEPQTVAVATSTANSVANSVTSRAAANLRRNRVESPTVPQAQVQREPVREPAVVAVAPLNPESYAPLTEQIPGRMVSPDLPGLPGADHFLPNETLTGYIWPAKGLLTSGYGWRWGRMHSGIDIAADVGTPIYAAASGVIEYAGWNSGGYGNMVEIRHADGSMTRYAHMNALYVQEGQRVGQSEQIGEMGSTGYSTGPHLHFEVHPVASGGAVNPMAYLPAN